MELEWTKAQLKKIKFFFYENSNRAGKTLARLVKAKQRKAHIAKVLDNNNKCCTELPQIMQTFLDFYKGIYSTQNPNELVMKKFLEGIVLPKLNIDQVDFLNTPITDKEVKEAIRASKNNKAVGPDGFPNEFYKIFEKTLVPHLTSVYNNILAEGEMPLNFYKAIITLIPKPGRDPDLCGSYRPISLLNTDFKLFSKILSDRLKAISGEFIHINQTGFIPGRQGRDNIRKAINVIYALNKQKKPAMVISADAEKAFDFVEPKFLFETMGKMGIEGNFMRWLRAIYKNPQSSLLINGEISNFFPLQRGTRQGCPLSPLLFNIALEVLASAIRQNKRIEGVKIGGQETKLSLYADDLLVYITKPEETLPELLKLMDDFGKVSGYSINKEKSFALVFGEGAVQEEHLKKLSPFPISESGLKYLGVTLTKNLRNLYTANFLPLLKNLKEEVQPWKKLMTSWLGKINLYKMIVLPKLLYRLMAIPIQLPSSFFRSSDDLLRDIVWNGKKPRIKKQVMFQLKEKGGLNVPDIKLYHVAASVAGLYDWYHETKAPESPQGLMDLLQEEVNLFQYLQLKAMVTSPLNRAGIVRELQKIEKILFKINKAPGRLGRIYRELKEMFYAPSVDYIKKWSKDLEIPLAQEEEKKIWQHMNKCVFSLEVREIQVKLTTRYYLTPERMKFVDPGGGGACWRGCGEMGTYIHCWWSCGKVRLFWSEVWRIINKVAGMVVPFRPEIALLGLYPNMSCLKKCQDSCKIIFLAAINIITRHWRSVEDLAVGELFQRILYMYTMEELHADIHNKKQGFEDI
uniref:Reverse transcriptase domain-containing protein n=1 Tax=Sphenodon punctatus TaxID=8508 RepID=A0A8D0GM46_SPHPU